MVNWKSPELSVVVPAFNEQDAISATIVTLEEVLQQLNVSFEVIIVDDGSTDLTLFWLKQHLKDKSWLRTIVLPRNLGHMAAISSGLEAAKGNYVLTIDADLQDPPRYIKEMYEIAVSNPSVEVVQTVRIDRSSDSLFKRLSAGIFYRAASTLAGFEVIKDGADFRLMKRNVVDFLNALPEKNQIYRLLIPYFGFETKYLDIKREERIAGKTKYSLRRMLALTLDSYLNFSNKPLKMFTRIGLYSSALFFAASMLSIALWIAGEGKLIPGWTSLVFIILFSNGLLLTALGLVGEYVGRIYVQVQNRPRIAWKELTNYSD